MFLRSLNFCPHFFGRVEKRILKKAQVSFEFYDVLNWETNNGNTHIAQYIGN